MGFGKGVGVTRGLPQLRTDAPSGQPPPVPTPFQVIHNPLTGRFQNQAAVVSSPILGSFGVPFPQYHGVPAQRLMAVMISPGRQNLWRMNCPAKRWRMTHVTGILQLSYSSVTSQLAFSRNINNNVLQGGNMFRSARLV